MAKARPKDTRKKPKIFRTQIPLSVKNIQNVSRVVLEFHGINHAGPSYEARVFLDNPQANESTRMTEKNGYVGSLYIFGHGGRCYGGPGHCKIPPTERFDPYDARRSHPLTPTFRYITITKYLKHLARKTKIALTVVPIPRSYDEMADFENLLQFEKVSLIIYDK